MNRYHLVHVTEFHYDGAVSESYNEVRLRPMHDEKQSCLSFRLGISPAVRSVAYRDAYDNWVHQFSVSVPHRYLRVEGESVVLAHDPEPLPADGCSLAELDSRKDALFEDHYEFLSATDYVPHLPQLRELVRASEQASDGTLLGFVQAASSLIHRKFEYVKGATHVHSSVEDSLRLGAGVCQDFAHLFLGVIRMRGVPGRYVSGYLVPTPDDEGKPSVEEVIGGQASHAWAEAYLPNGDPTGRWIALDPTLGKPVGPRHVRVACGRDYGDVAPVRGVYKGHAGQRLSVDVRVRPALDGDGREQLDGPAAAPAEPEHTDLPQQPAEREQQQQQ
jgi:transglutaminase-like putative cysteine protease